MRCSGGARNAAGEIEVEQEILAEGLFGGETVPPDHVAQRRQIGSLDHVSAAADIRRLPWSAAASRAASFSAATRLAGLALPTAAVANELP